MMTKAMDLQRWMAMLGAIGLGLPVSAGAAVVDTYEENESTLVAGTLKAGWFSVKEDFFGYVEGETYFAW